MSRPADSFVSRIRSASFNLKKASRAVNLLYDEAMEPSGLRGNQYTLLELLELLDPEGPLPIGDIARALVMDPTNATLNLRVDGRRLKFSDWETWTSSSAPLPRMSAERPLS